MSVSQSILCPDLDLEGSLEAAGKETTKGSHDGGKAGESNAVDLEGIEPDCGLPGQEVQVRPDAYGGKTSRGVNSCIAPGAI